MTKQQELLALSEQIKTDNVTPGLAKNAKRLVFGSGNVDADVVLVGEAPGKKEDETGQPFVGASGKLLDELLESVNIERKDVYITNIVKYRPKNNRDPLTNEKKEFWPFLIKQLSIIKPKIVATLGRHSGQAFIPSLRISADHGQPQSVRIVLGNEELGLTVLPLYHPAAAMYNGSLRKTLFSDFQSLNRILKQRDLRNTHLFSESAEAPRTDFSFLDVATATPRSDRITPESPQTHPGKQLRLRKLRT